MARLMRGHAKAAKSGSASSSLNFVCIKRGGEDRRRLRWQRPGWQSAPESRQHVVDRTADDCAGRRSRSAAAVSASPSNEFGVDRIRIAPQRLDPRHAEPTRPQLERRLRHRAACSRRALAAGRSIARASSTKKFAALRGRRRKPRPPTAASRCTKRESTVGVPSRLMARLRIDALLPHRHDEIMRRLADLALRRREAERAAHRPVEKGIALSPAAARSSRRDRRAA